MTAPLRFPLAAAAAADGPVLAARSSTVDFMDELGERRLGLDANGTQLHVLHFRKEFAESPLFESALRARVDEVRHLSHPSLATVHAVERGDASELALVSAFVGGRRLSAMSPDDWGPAFAINAVRTVTPVLAMLHGAGAGLAHGTLSPDRIILDPDERLIVVEHVIGPAIEALGLSRQDLNTLDLVIPDEIHPVPFNPRGDMVQLGVLTLSLLLGRRLPASDYPFAIPARLDEFAAGTGSPLLSIKMRTWLERALQIDERPFGTAKEAVDAFELLPNDIDIQRAESKRAWLAFPSETDSKTKPVSAPLQIKPVEAAAAPSVAPPAAATAAAVVALPLAEPVVADLPPDAGTADAPSANIITKLTRTDVAQPAMPTLPAISPSRVSRFGRATKWVIAGLVLLTAGEAIGLWLVAQTQAADIPNIRPPVASAVSAPVLPVLPVLIETLPTVPKAAQVDSVAAPPEPAPKAPALASAPTSAPKPASALRTGRLTVLSAIPLQVFMDGQLIGSSAAALTVGEGSHHFEFVNDALDFRLARNVNVTSGQMQSVDVAVPNGRININATPWAEVTIDGSVAGETPLANLALPIGVHTIVFRHPQLGERRQTILLKAGNLLRVTQTFQIPFLARGKR